MNKSNNPPSSASDALLATSATTTATTPSLPHVPWTVADLFAFRNDVFVFYHCLGTTWDLTTPIGCGIGAVMYWSGASKSLGASMGTTGLLVGGLGMLAGGAAYGYTASKGNAATPVPWTKAGVQDRAQRLRRNSIVRTLDASAWSGMLLAAILLASGRMPVASGSLGVLQGLTLGSSAGSVVAFVYMTAYQALYT